MISSSSTQNYWFRRGKTGLEDVERDAALRITSEPKERQINCREADSDKEHATYIRTLVVFWAQRSGKGKQGETDKASRNQGM